VALAGGVVGAGDGEVGAVDAGVDAAADGGVEGVGFADGEVPGIGGAHDGSGDGVFGAALGGGGEGEELVGVAAVEGVDLGELGSAVGEGAGLVQGDGAEPAELLEVDAALDEHAVAAGASHGGDVGDRDRDHQRTGRGGDEHGRGPQGPFGPVAAHPTTDEEDAGAEGEHRGGVDAGEALHELLAPALLFLGLADEVDDPGQGVGGGGGRRFGDEGPVAVRGAGDDRVAWGLVDGDRLAGDGRLVDRRGAVDDATVGGDVLSGADQEPVADRHGVDVDVAFGAIGRDDGDRSRGEVQQLADGIAGAVLGELLEGLADRVQERQRGGFGPGAERAGDHRRDGHQQLDADLALGHELLDRLGGEEPGADHRRRHEQRCRHDTRRAQRPGQVAGCDEQAAGRGPPHLLRRDQPREQPVGAVGLVGVGGGRGAHRGIRWLRHSATFSPISPRRTSAWRSRSTTAGLASR
jgi:hypothetical protein